MKNPGHVSMKALMIVVSTLFLAACGGGMSEVSLSGVSKDASIECIVCHEYKGDPNSIIPDGKTVSKTSGAKITEQWQLSAHNTSKGASCLDCHGFHNARSAKNCRHCHATVHTNSSTSCQSCHGGGASDSSNCLNCHSNAHATTTPPTKNPDSAGRCFSCHKDGSNFKRYTAVTIKHFNNFTGNGVHPAKYVTSNYQNSCTSCHEPHNPLKGQGSAERTAWAKSKHGNVTGVAWSNRDFKNYFDATTKSYACIRCHTATGFINFAAGNLTAPFPATTWAVTGDTGREVMTCKVCHSSSNFKNSVRQVPQFIAPYGATATAITAPMVFPNVGRSNLCIPCHAGRENGIAIKKTISDFSNASFKNPHYLAAAAVFYGYGGFQFYSSTKQTIYAPQAYTSRYGVIVDGTIITAAAASTSNSTPAIAVGDALVDEKAPWSHGKLGMNNFQTTKTAAVIAGKGNMVFTGTGGQCITCHLGSGVNPGLHSLNAFDIAKSTWKEGTPSTSSLGGSTNPARTGGTTYAGCYGCHTTESMEEVAHEERQLVDRALAFFKWQLLQVGTEYGVNYPYFYQPGTTTATKNWSGLAVPGGSGAATMGAAMNFELLTAEKGVHVHNRTYMKQLIFDSIQYLQTGKVTFSNRYIPTNAQTNPNGLINFTNYSTYLTANPDTILNPPTVAASPGGVPGQPISTTQLKAYITRKNTGTGTPAAIGSAATPLYTRQ